MKTSRRCKICLSPDRIAVDKAINAGKTVTKISKLFPALKLTKMNIWNHKTNHGLALSVNTAEDPPPQNPFDVLDQSEIDKFLSDIIRDVSERISSKVIQPTIPEALKAVEIALRKKDGSPWEELLKEFVLEISLSHGNNKKTDG